MHRVEVNGEAFVSEAAIRPLLEFAATFAADKTEGAGRIGRFREYRWDAQQALRRFEEQGGRRP